MSHPALLTADDRGRMLWQAACIETAPRFEAWPVVKLFMPDGAATWLLATIDLEDPDILWGLCDLGLGFPELGSVRLSEITVVRGALGLPVERDRHFKADRSIYAYADEALKAGRIVA
jgi:hypothetical protein